MTPTDEKRIVTAVFYVTVGFVIGYLFCAGVAKAAVVEVQVHAKRDGYARLHSEGVQVNGCTPADMGRCEWLTGRGLSFTTRRVKVHQGTNTIRLKASRFEDIPAEQLDYGWLRSSDPDRVPQQAAVPTMAVPFNWAYITGIVAGRTIEPKMERTSR